MLSKENYTHIKNNLEKVVAYYSYQDYKTANPNYKPYTKSGRRRHPNPYSLGDETLEAKKLYDIMFFNNEETLTREQEEEIKGYLLRIGLLTDILN